MARPSPSHPVARARTCHDHLAGRLGVALFDALVREGALLEPSEVPGPLEIGARGPELFRELGLDIEGLRNGRRRFAAACLDWTERRAHLAGALGAVLCARLVEQGWVVRRPETRAVELTEEGIRGLRESVGLRFEELY